MVSENEQSSPTAAAPPPAPVEYNPAVRCAICRSVGFVARYCPCTKAGERRLREFVEKV